MENRIRKALAEVEREHGVRIIYASESGSRAWGFPSTDSDYDIRFIYVRPRDWYLSIDLEQRRDVIEKPLIATFDISGWDIRKALQLLRKSNPPLLEWLNSPIVYLEIPSIVNHLRVTAPEYYSPLASAYHYLHMAQGNYREYLKTDPVWLKKYFYVLRPLLAIKWIEAKNFPVPMAFSELLLLLHDAELRGAIDDLLAKKTAGFELDRGARIPIISQYIENELKRLQTELGQLRAPKPSTEKLNELFRLVLERTWHAGVIQARDDSR